MTEDEMVGWHHQLNRLEFEQAPGDVKGQGSLVCCSLLLLLLLSCFSRIRLWDWEKGRPWAMNFKPGQEATSGQKRPLTLRECAA